MDIKIDNRFKVGISNRAISGFEDKLKKFEGNKLDSCFFYVYEPNDITSCDGLYYFRQYKNLCEVHCIKRLELTRERQLEQIQGYIIDTVKKTFQNERFGNVCIPEILNLETYKIFMYDGNMSLSNLRRKTTRSIFGTQFDVPTEEYLYCVHFDNDFNPISVSTQTLDMYMNITLHHSLKNVNTTQNPTPNKTIFGNIGNETNIKPIQINQTNNTHVTNDQNGTNLTNVTNDPRTKEDTSNIFGTKEDTSNIFGTKEDTSNIFGNTGNFSNFTNVFQKPEFKPTIGQF